jgi:hypothetical protein
MILSTWTGEADKKSNTLHPKMHYCNWADEKSLHSHKKHNHGFFPGKIACDYGCHFMVENRVYSQINIKNMKYNQKRNYVTIVNNLLTVSLNTSCNQHFLNRARNICHTAIQRNKRRTWVNTAIQRNLKRSKAEMVRMLEQKQSRQMF